ncbi:RNA polymerase sigma factor [Streptomyces violascens]|uniref:RNA polymerase sigma factor n=1 Tax=Streptomyces violascens TaxID=67381 RepID=UPI003668DF4C
MTSIPRGAIEQVAALYDREGAALLRHAKVLTGYQVQEAEDLASRAFEAAVVNWRKVGFLDPLVQRAWLRRTMRNKWIDDVRRARKLEQLRPDLLLKYLRDEPDPADAVLARGDLDACWAALKDFPPKRREVATMHFFEGMSAVAIGELLQISPSGVRRHIKLAQQALLSAVGAATDETQTRAAASHEQEGERA